MSYPAGSLDIEKLKDAVYDWVFSVVGGVIGPGQIIWRQQGEPLPRRPCVTLRIIDGPRPIARSGNLMSMKNGDATIYGMQHEMIVSVQIFGNNDVKRPSAHQIAIDLNSSLLRQTILDDLKPKGLSVQELGRPTNTTALEESRYEERQAFEILFGCVQNIGDQPGSIDTINAEYDVSDNVIDSSIDLT